MDLLHEILKVISENGSAIASDFYHMTRDSRRIRRVLNDLVDRGVLEKETRHRPRTDVTETYFFGNKGLLTAKVDDMFHELMEYGSELDMDGRIVRSYTNLKQYMEVEYLENPDKEE